MNAFPSSLLAGHSEFKRRLFAQKRDSFQKLAALGQAPQTLVIACCDSRVAPEAIFNAAPGEIFVVRNVANLVPSYSPDGEHHSTSAALEFAVEGLKVKHVVVLGHGHCGGVAAALEDAAEPLSPGDFIGKWMGILSAAAKAVAADQSLSRAQRQTALEQKSIAISIANLRSFPCVSTLEEEGRLSLHGAWLDISSGELWLMDAESGDFALPPDATA